MQLNDKKSNIYDNLLTLLHKKEEIKKYLLWTSLQNNKTTN
jgi:hypothetical protein